MKCGINPLLLAAGWLVFAVPCCQGQAGAATIPATSSTASAAYTPTMTFDVASVRENKSGNSYGGVTMSGQFAPHTTNLRLMNWRTESLINMAYGMNEHQIMGAPKWPWPTVFVIEAKGDSVADCEAGDTYHLLVARGPKLGAEGSMPLADESKILGDRTLPVIRQKNDGLGYDFIAHGCTMTDWIGMLAAQFGRPVID